MDDRNFDKLLKGILENPPVFRATDKAISDMGKLLEKADKRERFGGMVWPPWLLLPLLLLPFLTASIIYYNKYKKSNKTINELNLQLQQFHTDTITHNFTLYHYDTVYNTIYKNVLVEQAGEASIEQANSNLLNTSLSSLGFTPSSHFLVNPLSLKSKGQMPAFAGQETLPGILSFGNGGGFSLAKANAILEASSHLLAALKKAGIGEEEKERILTSLEKITILLPGMVYLQFPYNPFLSDDYMIVPVATSEKKQKKRINPLGYFIPTGFNLGATESPIAFFMNIPGNSQKSHLFGLSAQIKFVRNFRMTLGLEKLNVTFKTESEDDFSNFPMVEPNDPTDKLQDLHGELNYVQIPIGFRYQFKENNKFKPFVGAAMIARTPTNQKFKYEFENTNEEYKLEQTFKSHPFTINSIRASVGFDYNFWKNFNLEVESIYNHDFRMNSFEYVKLKFFGLKFGLNYDF